MENVIFCTSLITKISSNCSSLPQIEIPSSVTIIESSAFSGCTSLSKIKFQSSLTIIESFTFYNCGSLVTFEVPSSVTTIERYAFLGCSALSSVFIPFSVSSIGENIFKTSSFLSNNKNHASLINDDCLQKREEHFAKLATLKIPYSFELFDTLIEITIPS